MPMVQTPYLEAAKVEKKLNGKNNQQMYLVVI